MWLRRNELRLCGNGHYHSAPSAPAPGCMPPIPGHQDRGLPPRYRVRRRGCADLCGVISTRGWQSIRRRWPRRRLSTECAGPRVVVGWAAKAPRRTGSNHRPVVSAGAIVTGVSGPAAIAGPVERIRGSDRHAHRRPSTTRRDRCIGWLPPLIRWHASFKNAVACATTFQTPICPQRAARKAAHHIAQRFAPLPPSDIGGDVVDAAGADPLRAASGRLSRARGHSGSSSAAKSRRGTAECRVPAGR